MEWALLAFLAFIQTALDAVTIFTRDLDAWLYTFDDYPHYGRFFFVTSGIGGHHPPDRSSEHPPRVKVPAAKR